MKKLTYEEVKQSFEAEGYTLLSSEFKNTRTYLEYICPNGHKHKIIWGNWTQGKRCGRCKGNIEVTYEQVKTSLEVEGYKLLSKEYIKTHNDLDFICPNGHKHKITWSVWQRGIRCGKCSNYYNVTYEFVKQSFKSEGYTLLSKEYINEHQYLDYICPNGHRHKILWGPWQQGQRCGKCHYMTYDKVKQSFEKEGYILLSKEYVNNKSYLNYICHNNHFHKIIWNSWQHGQRCPLCSMNGTSNPEREIQKYVKEIYPDIVLTNDRTTIQNPKTGCFLELDIYMPEIKKAIEYNGAYWHSGKYSKYKDNIKQQVCKDKEIELLVIDEKEWIENKDFNMIDNFIGE